MIIKTWQARKEKKLTLKQLEELTGIGKTTLSGYAFLILMTDKYNHIEFHEANIC